MANTLPDEPVCDCDTSPRDELDTQLAILQQFMDEGGCLRSWFLSAGIMGVISTALLIADDSGLLADEASPDAGLSALRASLIPHITPELLQHVTEQIAAMWQAPPAEQVN